ncbi:FG-GAP repeat protein [Candidatus Villigracilis proximus]|uniref:FG-GAP repeat protein n=1 Tax=Candidatus Villigracilis proximus TaxID=3140683 RepID=UPI0031ECA4B2
MNGNETDNSANASGAAYVFTRNGTTWSQQAYLKASNAEAGDLLGNSVAISGDTLIVSAYYEDSNATGVNGNQADNSATESGAAYVFTRSGTTWSQQAYLKASNTGSSDNFGWLVAISGDTLVVGAHLEDSNATGMNGNQADNSAAGSGAGYVYLMDTIAPTATSITRASATPTSASSVDFTVTFSESVIGVDPGDFTLTTTGVSSAAVSGISGSGSVYTVTVNTGVGSGTLRLDVLDNDGITDLSLNPLAVGLTTGEFYTISKTPIFTDVPYSYWANSYIERLYTASITGGCVLSPAIPPR